MKVMTIFGTRPEAIKMAPVVKELLKHPEIEVLGIHESAADQAKIPVIEKNGIEIAMLNYTLSSGSLSPLRP